MSRNGETETVSKMSPNLSKHGTNVGAHDAKWMYQPTLKQHRNILLQIELLKFPTYMYSKFHA